MERKLERMKENKSFDNREILLIRGRQMCLCVKLYLYTCVCVSVLRFLTFFYLLFPHPPINKRRKKEIIKWREGEKK